MRILVIGSGAREHALCWKIAQSPLAERIFCAPGNGGISQIAECINIKAEDIDGLLDFALAERIDFTVVGPEIPLSLGIVDKFVSRGLKIFGPNKAAARLEASKVFSKELMAKYKIPTASFKVFDNAKEAKEYINQIGTPCVIKADGLAAGKGVVVAKDTQEAIEAVSLMMERKAFGESGAKVIIEECLAGQEASILVITDSNNVAVLSSAQDHKRILDNDSGPNTGGMGAYSPAPLVSQDLLSVILKEIIYPTISGLKKEGIEYKGVLYAGIMVTSEGPKTLEFNVRFGDPETQAILPRLKSDLVEVMLAAADGRLSKVKDLDWDSRSCVCVVVASKGYPGEYEKNKEISGLKDAAQLKDIAIFHAGTRKKVVNDPGQKQDVEFFTDGGRVLGVTGLGEGVKEAIDKTYQAVGKISFEGMQYRRDIGRKALI